jgi:hypothetical protein
VLFFWKEEEANAKIEDNPNNGDQSGEYTENELSVGTHLSFILYRF